MPGGLLESLLSWAEASSVLVKPVSSEGSRRCLGSCHGSMGTTLDQSLEIIGFVGGFTKKEASVRDEVGLEYGDIVLPGQRFNL